MAEALAPTPFEQFLDGEAASERRHELVGGRVYALAGGSERRDLVAGLMYEALALAPGRPAGGAVTKKSLDCRACGALEGTRRNG